MVAPILRRAQALTAKPHPIARSAPSLGAVRPALLKVRALGALEQAFSAGCCLIACVHLRGRSRSSVVRMSSVSQEQGKKELEQFRSRADHSWLNDLVVDPETEKCQPNKTSRQVRSGHYVLVKPTALPRPRFVTFSPLMAAELGLSEAACRTEEFLRFFSGDVDALPGLRSWATPYALSIFGKEMNENCPFKNGNGYGDGRALSVGEVVVNGQRWEMQLKGGGTTPFCRGADGRAVLRSSVREFLASEAMHCMGVSTTRALSLVLSEEETVQRPWYSDQLRPVVDEAYLAKVAPQFADAPEELKRMALAQIKSQMRNPDKLQVEKCAITCRVAPSFLRVGHVELHGRRAHRGGKQELEHLELIVKHLLKREYADVDDPSADLQSRILRMIGEFAKRLSKLMADWLRVGYCQGNFNSDNCLAAGRTMDYGPFGFIEKYEPLWNMWVGGGEHFAFMNQPQAAQRNFFSFVKAVSPLLDQAGAKEAQALVNGFMNVCERACDDMWRRKMGLQSADAQSKELFEALEELMSKSSVDYTIFWRQLAELPGTGADASDTSLLAPLQEAFYAKLSEPLVGEWGKWLRRWLTRLKEEGRPPAEAAALMRQTSPKYIPREWMLVEAYNAADRGDYSVLQELYTLFSHPFDEQPQFEGRYYRRAPENACQQPGTAFMS